MSATAEAFGDLRPLMFSIAYRMLGSVTEAEDVVQEAFLRYHRALTGASGASGATRPQSPKAYLSAVTTRLCIDELRSARARREAYVGEWLPEPLLTGERVVAGQGMPSDPADAAERSDSLSMAFLLLLERLSAVERAVFLLRDVFGYDYGEIAGIVGKSAENCRQLARRARQHVTERRPRFEPSAREREALAARFLAAAHEGDMAGLVALLAADVSVHGDNGGMRPAWRRPVTGRDKVARLLIGLARQVREAGGSVRPVEVNGQPGALAVDSAGRLISVLQLDIADGRVQVIRSVISRGKLLHLGPLADLAAFYERRRAGAGGGSGGGPV